MRYETDLMRLILTNETAQAMIDWVSRIYGESYVALWIYQVLGSALTGPGEIAEELRQETSPATATSQGLLSMWEEHYGLPTDESLSDEARRDKLILQSQVWGQCNPAKLAQAVSNLLGGAEVTVEERTDGHDTTPARDAAYMFLVSVHGDTPNTTGAGALIREMSPAHLTPVLRMDLREQTPRYYLGPGVHNSGTRTHNIPGVDPADYTILLDELSHYMIDEEDLLLFD